MLPADTARFRTDDSELLVRAAFACPVCLREASELAFDPMADAYDAVVRCHCDSCRDGWLVHLAPEQILRLGLMARLT